MKINIQLNTTKLLLASTIMAQAFTPNAMADVNFKNCKIYTANRVFDGNTLFAAQPMSIVVDRERIHGIMPASDVDFDCKKEYDLGDATILPGFIESHAHITFQNVPTETVLRHGVTTARDVAGMLTSPSGGEGELRLLNTGPIIQAEGGYPLNLFGDHGHEDNDDTDHHAATIAVVAETVEQAETHVEHIANSGAVAIKVVLERGGEAGAPWSGGHGHGHGGDTGGDWPILSEEILVAIVEKAHELGLPVIAHAGEQEGFDRAVAAGVDEFAHIPCAEVSEESISAAVAQGIRFQTTSDTLSGCHGIATNFHRILHAQTHIEAHHGPIAEPIIYASEIGHNDVPWGVNGQELINNLLNFAGHNPVDFGHVMRVMKGATSVPGALIGEQIGEPLLGTLQTGAPADIIAVKGNAFERFKLIEYPGLVVSGGDEIVNHFK